jgi:hypothetical protein
MSHALMEFKITPAVADLFIEDHELDADLECAEDEASPVRQAWVADTLARNNRAVDRAEYLESLQEQAEQDLVRYKPANKRRMTNAQFNA